MKHYFNCVHCDNETMLMFEKRYFSLNTSFNNYTSFNNMMPTIYLKILQQKNKREGTDEGNVMKP